MQIIPFKSNTTDDAIHPYDNMISDILKGKRILVGSSKAIPLYILINPADYLYIMREMNDADILPRKERHIEIQLNGMQFIQSTDVPVGFFDVVGK